MFDYGSWRLPILLVRYLLRFPGVLGRCQRRMNMEGIEGIGRLGLLFFDICRERNQVIGRYLGRYVKPLRNASHTQVYT